MSLTSEEVEKIAGLARLELADDEKESFRENISSVLEYVGKLSKVDVEDTEPMSHSVPVLNVLREDEAVPCAKGVRDQVVDSFPESEDDMLKVKAVFS
ncbi:MAG: Asp-tRNA(Asn)/Glu-tRNA(Gln) amidotransferase subunit GatC [Patescibacteria group bacterium]|nr:Asp-tRNA(Asn)/Glu-tRNA(Gln) amidotransferase subunit GatC [Patescibacteria group bacterium]